MIVSLLLIVNVIICLKLGVMKWNQNSPFFVFYLMLVAFYIFPSLFDRINSLVYFHDFAAPVFLDFETVAIGQLVVFIILSIFLVLELALSRRLPVHRLENCHLGFLSVFPFITLAVVCYGYFKFGYGFLVLGFISARHGEFGLIPLAIQYSAILSIPLVAIYLSQKKYFYFAVSMVSVLAPIFLGGARQAGFVAIFSIFYVIFRRVRLPVYLGFILFMFLVPAVEVFSGIAKHVRNLESVENRVMFFQKLPDSLVGVDYSGESSVRYVYYQIVSGVDIDRSGEFIYLVRTLLAWLPSSLDFFGIKPSDFEFNMFESLMSGYSGSMHPTYFGSILADAGPWLFIWVLFSFVLMKFCEKLVQISSNYAPYVHVFLFYVSVMWARGSLYAPTVLLVVVTILVIAQKMLNSAFRTTIKVA